MRHQVIPPREAEGIDSMEKWILKNRTAAKIILISLILLHNVISSETKRFQKIIREEKEIRKKALGA